MNCMCDILIIKVKLYSSVSLLSILFLKYNSAFLLLGKQFIYWKLTMYGTPGGSSGRFNFNMALT